MNSTTSMVSHKHLKACFDWQINGYRAGLLPKAPAAAVPAFTRDASRQRHAAFLFQKADRAIVEFSRLRAQHSSLDSSQLERSLEGYARAFRGLASANPCSSAAEQRATRVAR